MRSVEILMGWLLIFVVVGSAIVSVGEDIERRHGLLLIGSLFGDVGCAAMIGGSIWRDRLA